MISTFTFSFNRILFLFRWIVLLFTFQTISAQAPAITSFSPTSGPVGTTVTISGSNFSATASENIVFFGATQAVVTAASATSLTVTVPIGASYQPISVLNNATVLLGSSAIPFTVTFTPSKGKITVDDIQPKVNFATSNFTEIIANGDFDGDGKVDLAVTIPTSGLVTVFRNTSVSGSITSSSMTAAGNFTVEVGPTGIAIGDLDGDGKLDIVTTNFTSGTISILRNTSSGVGNITFGAQVSYITASRPYRLAIGDIDGDGRADIATANNSVNSVSVLRNISSGTGSINFSPKIDFAVGTSPYGISFGDLDGDNKIEIVTANSSATEAVSVLHNTSTIGTISFIPRIPFSTTFTAYDVAIGDLNGDGKLDLAVANANGNYVSVFRNTSTAIGNISFDTKIDFATSAGINQIAIGDLDGDGNLDLAVNNRNTFLSIFRNTGVSGGAISFAPKVDFTNNNNANSIILDDIDGDGKNDLATANFNGNNNISVFRNSPLFEPTTQATNVVFSGTTGTTTTANWTNGNGSSRVVFMYAGTSGSPVPVNYTTYTANTAFGTGTQIGTTGWYCIYNGTGTR